VQLKTTAVQRGRVALKLSAVERLAKDVRPALIVVFESSAKGEILAGRLIHLGVAAIRRIRDHIS
jgi:hypothetical protein